MSQPNVCYSHKNTSMNTHSQKQGDPTMRKERCSFSGVTGSKPGQVNVNSFWEHTLESTEKEST